MTVMPHLALITWDEDNGTTNQVALLVVTPNLKGQITRSLNHYSVLATIADELGVPRLGQSKQAEPVIYGVG